MIKYITKIRSTILKIENFLIRLRISSRLNKSSTKSKPKAQQLDVYWDESFKNELAFWGEDNVWKEIEFLLSHSKGKVVDMCCGVGGTIKQLKKYPNLDIYGFDISDYLIDGAIKSGINPNKLKVANAIDTKYENDFFNYSYSIGSLEHFIEEEIESFLLETSRITKIASFHQIPVSRDRKFEGWLDLDQSYFNKPEAWWLKKFKKHFKEVSVIDSTWNDPISFGKWFICIK